MSSETKSIIKNYLVVVALIGVVFAGVVEAFSLSIFIPQVKNF